MTKDVSGRVPDGTGLSSPTEPQERLGPSGFDPSRDELPRDLDRASYGDKPRHLPRPEAAILESFVDDMRARLGGMSDSDLSTVILGCLHVSPINCWCITYALADVVYPFAAEEMEARRDSDGSPQGRDREDGLDGEAATARAEGIAQTPPALSHGDRG